MRSLLYFTGRTPSPFPAEPEQLFLVSAAHKPVDYKRAVPKFEEISCDVAPVVKAEAPCNKRVRNIEHRDVSLTVPQKVVGTGRVAAISRDVTRFVNARAQGI